MIEAPYCIEFYQTGAIGFFHRRKDGFYVNLSQFAGLSEKEYGPYPDVHVAAEAMRKLNEVVENPDPLHKWRNPKYQLSVCRDARTKKWTVIAGSSKGFEETGTSFESEKEARETVGGFK